jgi:rieske iron-sulfur protein
MDEQNARLCANDSPCMSRRKVLQTVTASFAVMSGTAMMKAFADVPADLRPVAGDRLVSINAEGDPVPLKVADISVGSKPVLAWPYDPASKTIRDGSRLNKVLLVRVDVAAMDADTKERSGNGVLAFSAVCTHQGCDVSEWDKQENAMLCFCHFSKFSPLESGRVVAGPAPRNLPTLPLKLKGDELVVNGVFSAPVGIQAS